MKQTDTAFVGAALVAALQPLGAHKGRPYAMISVDQP
jgi:hypothetical protein